MMAILKKDEFKKVIKSAKKRMKNCKL